MHLYLTSGLLNQSLKIQNKTIGKKRLAKESHGEIYFTIKVSLFGFPNPRIIFRCDSWIKFSSTIIIFITLN